jgi:hypothetical protein
MFLKRCSKPEIKKRNDNGDNDNKKNKEEDVMMCGNNCKLGENEDSCTLLPTLFDSRSTSYNCCRNGKLRLAFQPPLTKLFVCLTTIT